MSKDKDVMVWAIPQENKAEVEGNTVPGKEFVRGEFGDGVKKASIAGEAVNSLMAKMKEANLLYSFRLKA